MNYMNKLLERIEKSEKQDKKLVFIMIGALLLVVISLLSDNIYLFVLAVGGFLLGLVIIETSYLHERIDDLRSDIDERILNIHIKMSQKNDKSASKIESNKHES